MQKIIIRYLGYALLVMAVTSAMLGLAYWLPGSLQFDRLVPGINVLTSEFSPVELLQNVLLLWCLAAFGWIALRQYVLRILFRRPPEYSLPNVQSWLVDMTVFRD